MCSVRKGVLRKFAKFTRNTCARVSFLIKLQASAFNFIKKETLAQVFSRVSFLIKLQASTFNFIKKETLAQVFSCKFCKFSKNTFFYRKLPRDCFWYLFFVVTFAGYPECFLFNIICKCDTPTITFRDVFKTLSNI